MASEESNLEADANLQKARANFPLKLVETTGERALQRWEELKRSGPGSPVVLGTDEGDQGYSFNNLLNPFYPDGPHVPKSPSVEEILAAAETIRFPEDLATLRKREAEASRKWFKEQLARNPQMKLPTVIERGPTGTRTYTRQETLASMEAEPSEPPIGDWPEKPDGDPGLTVASDLMKSTPFKKVYIGIASTDDWTTIPAVLRYGGWNECPASSYHVAAMRRWRDLYGAELVGLSSDTMNLRVKKRPGTRDEALALAHEHYIYCADVIDQGLRTYSALAASLMANDWWFFWWD